MSPCGGKRVVRTLSERKHSGGGIGKVIWVGYPPIMAVSGHRAGLTAAAVRLSSICGTALLRVGSLKAATALDKIIGADIPVEAAKRRI